MGPDAAKRRVLHGPVTARRSQRCSFPRSSPRPRWRASFRDVRDVQGGNYPCNSPRCGHGGPYLFGQGGWVLIQGVWNDVPALLMIQCREVKGTLAMSRAGETWRGLCNPRRLTKIFLRK